MFDDRVAAINRFLVFFIFLFSAKIVFAENRDVKEISVIISHSDGRITDTTELSQNKQEGNSKNSLYLQFNTSGLFSSLSDWKSQLHMPDGTHPSSSCIVFGAEGGWVINEFFQIGVGLEFFFTTKVAANETAGDQVNSTFFYGTIKASTPLESIPEFYLFASLDIGSIKATEALENYYYSGRSFDRTGKTNAYRLTIGAQYYLIDNWSIMAGAGYLFGKVKTVTVDDQTWPDFSLDLSGFLIRFAVDYHFML